MGLTLPPISFEGSHEEREGILGCSFAVVGRMTGLCDNNNKLKILN